MLGFGALVVYRVVFGGGVLVLGVLRGCRVLYTLWSCALSGFYALIISGVAVGAGVYNEVDLGYIHTHFLQFYTSALLISVLLSVYLFVRSGRASDDERAPAGNSGKCVLRILMLLIRLFGCLDDFEPEWTFFLFRLRDVRFLHGTRAESTNQKF